jgi:HK97 family phage major capsid protein
MNLKRFYDAANKAEARVQQIAAQINDLFEEGQNEEAMALRPQLDEAKAAAKEASQLYLSMMAATTSEIDPAQRFVPAGGDPEPQAVKDLRATPEYMKAFFNAFKAGVSPKSIASGMHRAESYKPLLDALTETGGDPVGSEGGFVLPIDFDNMIHEITRQFLDLSNYVNVEEVRTYSGWRAIELNTAALPFAVLTENEDMDETENPAFKKIEYTIKDYGGYIPVTNDLLADTPVAIMSYLSKWMGKKVVLTNNSLILAIINALSPVNVPDSKKLMEAMKTVLNKTLDPDISVSANIFCNQTGFDLLDQLVDGTGRPLLQPDPTNATQMFFKGRRVVLLADRLWPNLTEGGNFTRVAVGDGRELMTFFRRAGFEMAATTIGGDAWRRNNTEVRGIMRADVKSVDTAAMSVLKVTIPG